MQLSIIWTKPVALGEPYQSRVLNGVESSAEVARSQT